MTPRSEEQRHNRAARRREVARDMRALLKRVSTLRCDCPAAQPHTSDCVIHDVRCWLAVHKDGDGS